MKFLIVGDLHGQKPEIMFNDFDAIIAPGDFCSDATRKYMFEALKKRLDNPKLKLEWYKLIGKAKAKEEIKKSIEDGRQILKQLNSLNKPVYIVPGNWDWTKDDGSKWLLLRKDHYKELLNGLKNIIDTHHKIISVNGYQIIGHGISSGPEYPQYEMDLKRFSKKELKEKKNDYEKIKRKVNSLFKKATKPLIFLSHNVPFNTKIDEITDKTSPRYGYHYGSLIAREMIEKHKPLVCVGGHMHEHFGEDKIGSTVCINAGFGSRVNTLLELDNNKIKKLIFKKK